MDGILRNRQVLIQELGRIGIIGMNATYARRSDDRDIGLLRGIKSAYRRLVRKVEVRAGAVTRLS